MTVEQPSTPDPDGDVVAPTVVAPTPRQGPAARWRRVRAEPEAGMSTAEYAVGTVAACAFAAVLYQVVTGGSIVSALGDLVESALAVLS
ncbi:Protein of unknown function [Geodermatophilus dictyosporus]|uniref:DUF4244 domain-containing protein n=1 Tax=Geodermatophilus dictyosporus TaxID=1523247 RepID=A0A1I5N929_9ACTN|nr:DUF4244 domain-containing protein [Geodermatophilus dictyosporus]SFP17866.1 Protein of unknown function [Geodermatophilus dictyosporus]